MAGTDGRPLIRRRFVRRRFLAGTGAVGGYNSGLAPTPGKEDVIPKARQVYDMAERKKLYAEIQRKGVESLYSSILLQYNVARVFAVTKVGNLAAFYGGEGKPRYANLWI
jgi:ABC-type transport system substrate-binding protein